MTITEDDLSHAEDQANDKAILFASLREVHHAISTERKPGEFTIAEYAQANNMTITTSGNAITYRVERGMIARVVDKDGKPQKRLIDSKMRTVFVLVKGL
jgi:hypothetical protein